MATSSINVIPTALRKQLEAADKCFADGNVKAAKMHADMAAALFSSVPDAQRAQAAYKVHAAAAAKDKLGKVDHYAVLGVKTNGAKPDITTHIDAVRKQHKALVDTLAPGTTTNAAVAAAYKLVNEAFSALTDIKKNDGPSLIKRPPPPRQQQAPRRRAPKKEEVAEAEEDGEDEDYYGGRRSRRPSKY